MPCSRSLSCVAFRFVPPSILSTPQNENEDSGVSNLRSENVNGSKCYYIIRKC